MIHKIKTVTWEVRSHGFETTLTAKGRVENIQIGMPSIDNSENWTKPYIKRRVWHLQDVLKCMKKIEKEKEEKVYHTIKELKDAGIIRKGEPVIVIPDWAEKEK